MTLYALFAYFHLIKFWNLHNLVTILIFLWDFRYSVSLITGFLINRNLKKVLLKVHKTFKTKIKRQLFFAIDYRLECKCYIRSSNK